MQANEDRLKALMIGGLDGDGRSHAALLSAIAIVLRAFYCRRLGQLGDEIEDLVQETLIAVHVRRASFDRTRAFTPWLFAIARYKLIDRFRRTRHLQPLDGLEDVLAGPGFEEASIAALDVERLLDTLPPKQAGAIRRTRLDGLSTAEAARDAGIGESDVKVSVHRGLKALAARVRKSRA